MNLESIKREHEKNWELRNRGHTIGGYATVNFLLLELKKVEERFKCGHRKIDWDDSYGACVACITKQAMFDNEDEHEQETVDSRIFSGPNSKKLWKEINSARSKRDLRWALYNMGCHLQRLEGRVRNLENEPED